MNKKENTILFVESGRSVPQSKAKGYKRVYVYSGELLGADPVDDISMDQVDQHGSYYRAGQEIDWIYDAFVKKEEKEALNEMLSDDRGHTFLKLEILRAVGKIFFSFMLLEEFKRKYKINDPIEFVPSPFSSQLYSVISQRKGMFPEGVTIPQWYFRRMRWNEWKKRFVYTSAVYIYPLAVSLLMKIKKGVTHKAKKTYQFGVFAWNSWFGFSKVPYRMDVLEDEKGVNPDNTLYIVEGRLSDKNFDKLKSNGYDYCYFRNMLRSFSFWQYFKEIYPRVHGGMKSIVVLKSRNMYVIESYLKILRCSILWEIFYTQYDIKTFLTVQEPGHTARVLMQKKRGAKHIFVFVSSSYNPFYRSDMQSHDDSNYGFMIYDEMISSNMSNQYIKKNNNFISNYVDCGVFRSDVIHKIKHTPNLKERMKKILHVPLDKTIIGFFDNQIGRMGMLDLEEGYKILKDVYRLLDSNKDYFMIYRSRIGCNIPKGSKVLVELNKLLNHSRVRHINAFPEHYNAFDVMGACDLVIGAFTSSVPIESVVGGVKTICYVPSERFDKDVFVINTWPWFCVKNYDQLEEYSNYWLNQCTDEEFEEFQNNYVKKYADPYCDGQATKRLHEHLRQYNQQGVKPRIPELELV